MYISGHFSPHQRGFGFIDVKTLEADSVASIPFAPDTTTILGEDNVQITLSREEPSDQFPSGRLLLADDNGELQPIGSLFVPPHEASGWLESDLLRAEITFDNGRRASATILSLVERPRRFVVGRIQPLGSTVVLDLHKSLGNGELQVTPQMAERLAKAEGQQVVAMVNTDGKARCISQVTAAQPPYSPAAIRALAAVIGQGAHSPSEYPGDFNAIGLDKEAATKYALLTIGKMANGQESLSADMSVSGGVIPGAHAPVKDMLDHVCVTIDDPSTKDIDDALGAAWSGKPEDPILLSVHIADAAGEVGIGSTADVYAKTMATTSYFASGVNASMINPLLSEEALSLHIGQERRAMTVTMLVMPDGSLIGTEVSLTNIAVTARLNYKIVQDWLLSNNPQSLFPPGSQDNVKPGQEAMVTITMKALAEAAKRIQQGDIQQNSLDVLFNRADLEICVTDGKITTKPANPFPQAQLIVENAMIAANVAVAQWAAEHDIALLYRIHEGFGADRVTFNAGYMQHLNYELPEGADPLTFYMNAYRELQTKFDEDSIRKTRMLTILLARMVARASYSSQPKPHIAMGAQLYCHFTSPLRRYADLSVHRQLRAYLAGEQLPYTAQELNELGAWLDYRNGGANRTQSLERSALWGEFFKKRSGGFEWPATAIIESISKSGIRVRILSAGEVGTISPARALGLHFREAAQLKLAPGGLETRDGLFVVGQTVEVLLDRIDRRGFAELKLAS